MMPPRRRRVPTPPPDAGGGGMLMSGDERGYAAQNANATCSARWRRRSAGDARDFPGGGARGPRGARGGGGGPRPRRRAGRRGGGGDGGGGFQGGGGSGVRRRGRRSRRLFRGDSRLPPIGSSTGDPGAGEEEGAGRGAATGWRCIARSPLGAVLSVTLGPARRARVAFARRADAASAEKALREAPIEGRAVEAEVVCEARRRRASLDERRERGAIEDPRRDAARSRVLARRDPVVVYE